VPTTNWNSNAGSAVIVAGTAPNYGVSADQILLGWGTGGSQRLFAEEWNTAILFSTQGSVGRQTAASTRSASGTHTFIGTWVAGQLIYCYLDGVGNMGTSSGNADTLTAMPSTANIGSYYDNTAPYDSTIQRLVVYNSALSSGNVTTVTNAVQNGP